MEPGEVRMEPGGVGIKLKLEYMGGREPKLNYSTEYAYVSQHTDSGF